VYLIGIMRRSQRRGRLSLITAADARDGRPKSCQGRTAAGEAADAAKKPAEKAGILPRVIIHRRNPAQPSQKQSRRKPGGDGADGAELARLPTVYGDGETEPSRRRSAVVSDHSRDGRRDAETRQQENARGKMDPARE